MSKNKEEDLNLCSCIYDVLINENKECMLELEGKKYKPSDLNYVRDCISKYSDAFVYKERMSDIYERISLLTNEHLNIDDEIYCRVFRILFSYDTYLDLNKLRKLANISVWSNGKNDPKLSKFLIYWKGKKVSCHDCPPLITTIIDYIAYTTDIILDSDLEFSVLKSNIINDPDFLDKCRKSMVIPFK